MWLENKPGAWSQASLCFQLCEIEIDQERKARWVIWTSIGSVKQNRGVVCSLPAEFEGALGHPTTRSNQHHNALDSSKNVGVQAVGGQAG